MMLLSKRTGPWRVLLDFFPLHPISISISVSISIFTLIVSTSSISISIRVPIPIPPIPYLHLCLHLSLPLSVCLFVCISTYRSFRISCCCSPCILVIFSFVTRGRLHMWGYSTLTFHCLLLCILQLEGIGCARNLVDLP